MDFGGYLGLFWALAGIACARVLLAVLWLRRSMIAPNCGISGGAQIFFYILIQRVPLLTKMLVIITLAFDIFLLMVLI